MERYYLVSAQGDYFSLFYNLAFFVALLILLFEGYRRKYPMLKWILFLLFSRLVFILGTKLLTYSSVEWSILVNTFTLPDAPGKSLLGGLLFGCLALTGGKYLFGLKNNYPDAFAVALPIAIGIQRLGCFFTGCCFGRVAALPWSVQYPMYTPAHYHQFQSGVISPHEIVSLPLHPVQLYELVGSVLITFLLIMLRNHFKAKGSFLLFSLVMILVLRVVTEFFRDPMAHSLGGQMIGFLNTTQWVLLPILLVTLVLIFFRERGTMVQSTVSETDISLKKAFVLLVLFSISIYLLKNWFSYPEILALAVVMMAAIVVMFKLFLTNFWHRPYRVFYLAASVMPLLLMSQTTPQGGNDTLLIRTYHSIQAGFAKGELTNAHTVTSGTGCDGSSYTEYFLQEYTLGGLGYEYTIENPAEEYTTIWGVRTFWGLHHETMISTASQSEYKIIGIVPYIKYDWKWMGFGLGLNLGNLRYLTENIAEDGSHRPQSASQFTPVYPMVYFRLMPQKYVFADLGIADNFPSALPGYRTMIGVGSGLGLNNGTLVRFGTTTMHMYAEGYFPLNNRLVLQSLITWGKDAQYAEKRETQYAIGVGWRFNHREKTLTGL